MEATELYGFFKRLDRLTTGERAALKRSSGTPLNDAGGQSFGAFYKALPSNVPKWEEDKWFCTACLACSWPVSENQGIKLEECLARLNKDSSASFENRVIALLDNEWDARMQLKLFRMVKLVKQKGMKVNMPALLEDLLRWDSSTRVVQKKWARAFYNTPEFNEEDKSNVN